MVSFRQWLLKLLEWLFHGREATDVQIIVGGPRSGVSKMANKKATGAPVTLKLNRKGAVKGAVQPDQNWTTLPQTATIQLVKADGTPYAIRPTDVVTSNALTSDVSPPDVAQGADNLHYTLSFPTGFQAGTFTLADVIAGTFGGQADNFTASQKINVNLPAPLPVPTDVQILVS